MMRRKDRRGPVQSVIINICNRKQSRFSLLVQSIINCSKTHRANTCEYCHISTLPDAHIMIISSRWRMITCMKRANNTRHRLGKRSREKGFSVIYQKTIGLHYNWWDYNMSCIASDEPVGVTGCVKSAHLVHSRLNGEFLAGLKFILPFSPYFHDYSGKFMPDNSRIDINIVWNTLMISPLESRFVRRHTDAVGDNPGKDLIVL